LSNVDDDLFAGSARQIGVRFDAVVTAQQIKSYKPATCHWETLLERLRVPRDRVLHVAQSRFHDIAPASRLGFQTVWVDRRGNRAGTGATPHANAQPTLRVTSLKELADLVVR